MSIKFLISKDIEDSTLIDSDEMSRIDLTIQKKFLDQSNEFYLNEALELGVSESEIIVYDPNVDTEDLRDYNCKRIVEFHYLKDVFFALWKKGKLENDVYYQKYLEVTKLYNNLLSKLTPGRIRGYKPSETKTSNSFATATRHLGDSAGNRCNSQNFDCWDR